MMKIALIIAAAILGGLPADAAEPAGTVYSLSPAEIAAIDPKPRTDIGVVDDGTPAYDPLFDKSLFPDTERVRTDRRPHGEVGAFIGSGGARGIFGSTVVPLGENGSAAFSFENSQYPRQRYRRR